MKRLSTSLLIFILALLAVPERAWAEDVYLLTAQTIKGAKGDYNNPPSNHKFINKSGTEYTYTFSSAEASGDIYFRIGVDGWNNMQPTQKDYPLTINGASYSITNDCYGKDKAWKLTLDNTKYSSYTITVDIGSTRYVKVTGEASGTATIYNLVYLVDKTLKDEWLHTWLEGGATDKGITDWNSRPKIGSGDFSTITTYNNTDYYKKTFSVNKTTADSYKQIGAKIGGGNDLTSNVISSSWDNVQYIIVTSSGVKIVEKTATKYTVTVSSADESMGIVSATSVSVNATTGVEVTATPESGYDFVNWTVSDGVTVADSLSATTTVTATKTGTLTANFIKATSTEPIDPTLGTSSNGKAYYLATEENGENCIFGTHATKTTTGNTVTYSRILRFNDNGDGSYELNIPATISGNVWILEIDKQGTEPKYYYPEETVEVGSTNPDNKGSINGSFGGTSKVFTLTDRGDVDGIYNIKLNLNTLGIPAKWTITHDPLTRVAYYLSTASMSSASPVYDKRNADNDNFSNRFIGTTYFDKSAEVDYYVISNIVMTKDDNSIIAAKEFDSSVAKNNLNEDVLPTVNKLLLQGNGGYEFSTSDEHNQVSPNELPFKTSSKLQGLMQVEYNPSNGYNGHQEGNHYGMRGQIQIRSDVGTAETTSMTIVGPLVAASVGKTEWIWNYSNTDETLTNGISSNNVMKYDETENCYTITIVTNNEQQGNTFRFVRNGNSNYTWTEDATEARIPYYDNSKTGSAATVAAPNYVNYGGPDSDRDIDILFNRPAGKWTIKFYIVNEASSSDGSVKSKYYYTINAEDNFEVVIPSALKKVLRTYSYGSDVKPQDENVHVYVAHNFEGASEKDQYTNTKTGTVNLYEINYVPANTGVVLYCGEGKDAKTVTFVEANEYNVTNYAASKTDKKKLWKNTHEGDFNNDLEPVLARTYVDNSVKDEKSGNIIARNFCMSLFSKTNTGKELTKNGTKYTDYIGFFRVKSYISDNKAYLQYDKEIINENAQIFGQDTFGEAVSGGAKLAMVFEGFEDDNVVTGISDNLSAKPVLTDDAYYNLQGMRVEKPVKGIYIHNGKKVVIK